MWKSLFRSIVVTLLLGVVLCGAYPLTVTLLAGLLFPDKANGSLLYRDGTLVGSALIGQSFSRGEYFHGRPSAAGEKGYDASNSSGSNLGPTSKKLADRLQLDVDSLIKENPALRKGAIPIDLITASGSGLDPHLSPEAVLVQVERVAKARNADAGQIRRIVLSQVEDREVGFLGQKRVNILLLNLTLDNALPVKKVAHP